ncbi:MAG: bifunctional DNA-formamidopyrimidine glycosylase/DNA-(apurinic or apyrimidinic site) lyase [Chloroflexi bacterium]|nr:bifunctional DNA-formamidopyrimidine glycosylase/DNA-(apurinic or apyrimidinic site) lyase [Chloroflexota bacterium]
MPELPEVETIRRIVERELAGRTLSSVELTLPKLVRDSPLPDLELLVGRTLLAADRRAKVLVTHWSEGLSVLTHFKLAGQLAVLRPDGTRIVAGHPVPDPEGPFPHKATHLTMWFDETVAYYSDIRQFGWWRLMPSDDVDDALAAFRFGPEGTGTAGFNRDDLAGRLQRRRIAVKQALLDQRVVAGLGNIYVDEALHRARIHPRRSANDLNPDEIDRLHPAIGWALDRGIEQGGAAIRRGKAYPRDGFPTVHARKDEPCTTCGSAIVKITVGGRGTYYCPVCQPEPAGVS